jgi:hypothetical protein
MDRKTLLAGPLSFWLIDQQGNVRVLFGFDAPVMDIIHDSKLLLT